MSVRNIKTPVVTNLNYLEVLGLTAVDTERIFETFDFGTLLQDHNSEFVG